MKRREDCIFCKIVAGEIPCVKIYEDELVLAFLDIFPINAGHTLVIPKEHYELIAELPSNLTGPIYDAARKVVAAIRKSDLKCDGVNLHLADGEAAGQEIPHTHLHIIPRIKGDGAGYRFTSRGKAESAELEKVAFSIKSCL